MVLCIVSLAEDFNMVNLGTLCAGDCGAGKCLADGLGVFGKPAGIGQNQTAFGQRRALFYQKEPVAAPGHVACNGSVTGHVDGDSGMYAVGGQVVDCGARGVFQASLNHADGSFQLVPAGLYLAQIGQRGQHANGAMAAHSQKASIIKVEYSGSGSWIGGFEDHRPHQNLRSPGFAQNGPAKAVMLFTKNLQPFGHAAVAQIGTTGNYTAGRFACRVRINHRDYR